MDRFWIFDFRFWIEPAIRRWTGGERGWKRSKKQPRILLAVVDPSNPKPKIGNPK
jgi:hypothetical protein